MTAGARVTDEPRPALLNVVQWF